MCGVGEVVERARTVVLVELQAGVDGPRGGEAFGEREGVAHGEAVHEGAHVGDGGGVGVVGAVVDG